MHVAVSKDFLLCKGGSLASTEDPSEQELIQNHARVFQDSHSFFWIGLYKTHKGTVTLSAFWWKQIFSYRDEKDYTKMKTMFTNEEKYTLTGHFIRSNSFAINSAFANIITLSEKY